MKKLNFTLTELLIVFATLIVVMSLLQPALSRIVGSAHSTQCLSIQKNIHVCSSLFIQDNNDFIVALALPIAAGAKAIIPSSTVTWWPDLLKSYMSNLNDVTCVSTDKYGIGMNHPELGSWLSQRYKIDEVRAPSATVMFADATVIQNASELNPDLWFEVNPNLGTYYFRTPSNVPWYNTSPARVINRHLDKTNAMYVDGHGENMLTSEIGFQYPKNDPKAYWDR